jgi:hypothetical protein
MNDKSSAQDKAQEQDKYALIELVVDKTHRML